MPSGVRWNFKDSERIREWLNRLEPGARRSISHSVMVDAGKLVKADARENRIVRGRGDAKPLPDRLSYRTGHLTRSIATDNSQAPYRYVVGTPVEYSVVHELGLGPYPKRKFLEPAAEKVIAQDVPTLFRRALERSRGSTT